MVFSGIDFRACKRFEMRGALNANQIFDILIVVVYIAEKVVQRDKRNTSLTI